MPKINIRGTLIEPKSFKKGMKKRKKKKGKGEKSAIDTILMNLTKSLRGEK